MNNASFSKDFLRFSVCGRNSEIIHLIETTINGSPGQQTNNDILSISIAFHRYRITEYLVDSCNISIEYNGFLNSILASNYYFFFNHIAECNSEYNRLRKLRGNNCLNDQDDFKFNEFKI